MVFHTKHEIAPVVRDKFVGHWHGALGNAYTDLSEELLKREGEKLKYGIYVPKRKIKVDFRIISDNF